MFRFSFSGTRNIIFGTLKIGQNDPEIPNLEFESHGFLENQVFLPTEQAGTNICWMIYHDINFKICLSLFGWKENILPKQRIVYWWNCEYILEKTSLSLAVPCSVFRRLIATGAFDQGCSEQPSKLFLLETLAWTTICPRLAE